MENSLFKTGMCVQMKLVKIPTQYLGYIIACFVEAISKVFSLKYYDFQAVF